MLLWWSQEDGGECASLGSGHLKGYTSSHPRLSALPPNSLVTLSRPSCFLISSSVDDVSPWLDEAPNYRRWEKRKLREVAKQPSSTRVFNLSFLSPLRCPYGLPSLQGQDVTTHAYAIGHWERQDWLTGISRKSQHVKHSNSARNMAILSHRGRGGQLTHTIVIYQACYSTKWVRPKQVYPSARENPEFPCCC